MYKENDIVEWHESSPWDDEVPIKMEGIVIWFNDGLHVKNHKTGDITPLEGNYKILKREG